MDLLNNNHHHHHLDATHSHLHARGLVLPVASNDVHDRIMAPRDASPEAMAIPIPQPIVTDFGKTLNLSVAAAPFSHGLQGVDQYMNYLFANVIVVSFSILLLVTLAYRWIKMANAQIRHVVSNGRESDQRYFMHNHGDYWPKIKRSLLYAPLWKNRHNREIQITQAVSIGTLPSRFHTILLLAYVCSNIAYCLAVDWSKEHYEVVAELRGRSGVLAALNLIPTVLFALRNNPLIPILKISYDTFNLLHRWCARIMVLESILHTAMWAVNAANAGGMAQISLSLSTSMSYTWGMVGTAVMTFMALSALGPLRHAAYETFINSHRLMVLVAIVGVYLHLDLANLPMLPYVQLSMALWAAEVFWRIGRILYYNASRKRGLTKVTVEWLPNDACRVTFDLSRPWKWRPGCHVHAYIPTLALWSSHPFSLAWAENRSQAAPMEIEMEKLDNKMPASTSSAFDSAAQQNTQFGPRSSVFSSPLRNSVAAPRPSFASNHFNRSSQYDHSPKNMHTITETSNPSTPTTKSSPKTTLAKSTSNDSTASSTENLTLPRDANVTSLSLVIRARAGMTKHMYDKVAAAPNRRFTTWGAIEGPYGGHESLSSYGTVILFAGGVGITHCIGYIRQLLLQYQAGTTATRKILLVWSVPTTESLEWVRAWMDTILRMECRRDVLRIQLFVTKPRHRGEVVSSTGSVQMFPGRCNPATILQREIPERIGAMGVTVCGPGAFADSVRAACRGVVREVNLDFVEEAFTY